MSRKNIPLEGGPRTLTGLKFKDENIGIFSLDPGVDVNEPILYLTTIDSLTYENGVYKLTLGQGSHSNKKVVLESKNLQDDWKFKEVYEAVIHYIG